MQALKHELKKIGSLFLFFFIGFGYILILMKLFLKEYEINTYVLSKAVIGAIVAAKAVAVMDMTPWINRFHQAPRYVHVLYKTFIYTLAVLAIGALENIFHAYKETGAIGSALARFIETRHFSQFLAVTLCIGVVFFFHNCLGEIDSYMGKGKLKQFFFDKP